MLSDVKHQYQYQRRRSCSGDSFPCLQKNFPITVMKVNPHLRLKQSYSKSEYLIALVEMAKQRYVSDSNESTSLGILQRL